MVGVKIECEGVKDMFVVVDGQDRAAWLSRYAAGWNLGFT
jgi:hypothetical protein